MDIIQDKVNSQLLLSQYNSFLGSAIFASAKLFKDTLFFDPRFGLGAPFGGSEDADLFIRAINLNIPIYFSQDLTILHPKIIPGQYTLITMFRYGLGRGAFYAKHLYVHPLFFCLDI